MAKELIFGCDVQARLNHSWARGAGHIQSRGGAQFGAPFLRSFPSCLFKVSPLLLLPAAFNAAMVAGAVLGSLIGLGLIIWFFLHLFVYRRKKKDGQEEVANEIK